LKTKRKHSPTMAGRKSSTPISATSSPATTSPCLKPKPPFRGTRHLGPLNRGTSAGVWVPFYLPNVEQSHPRPFASKGWLFQTVAASWIHQRQCVESSAAWPARRVGDHLGF
jgi:hypothetical protein